MGRGLKTDFDLAKFQQQMAQDQAGKPKREQTEDKEAELETLKNVKVFLTEKLK